MQGHGDEEPERSEDGHSGEAGDALRPNEKRQEWAHGEPPE
ncbi:hypothetical protein [Streptomyces oceani]|nr:hypothetical protein [Streptomyces oceani]